MECRWRRTIALDDAYPLAAGFLCVSADQSRVSLVVGEGMDARSDRDRFTPKSWMSASLISFAVALIATLIVGVASGRTRLSEVREGGQIRQ